MTRTSHPTDHASADTRQRLLDAAGEIFARKGFHDSTVREICAKALANVAAVNYHFGDKDGLYRAVVRYAHSCGSSKAGLTGDSLRALPPEAAIEAYVHAFMAQISETGRHTWHGRLMAREMSEPTGVLDEIVEEHIRPRATALQGAMRALLGASADEATVRACVGSLVGQCLHYFHSRPVLERLFPDMRFDPESMQMLAKHIVAFTLAGVRGRREGR